MDLILELDPLLLIPFALVIVLMILPHISRRFKGKVSYILTGELNNLLAQDSAVVMVDIRPQKEFLAGRIEGSVNVSKAELKSKIQDGGSELEELKSQQIVVVCKSDMDSIDAAKQMEAAGFDNVAVLQGGFFRWKRDRLPVQKG